MTIANDVEVTRFELPMVEGEVVSDHEDPNAIPTAREVAAIHQQAYEEGYRAGHTEGYRDGETQVLGDYQVQTQILEQILRELTNPLATLDEELVQSTADLALLLARHIVRRELQLAPDEVIGVVRETLKQLPIAHRRATVHLHPEDVVLVRDALEVKQEPALWEFEADPLMTRGGCVVDTESSRIDASVEARLTALAATMFGGDRESDHND